MNKTILKDIIIKDNYLIDKKDKFLNILKHKYKKSELRICFRIETKNERSVLAIYILDSKNNISLKKEKELNTNQDIDNMLELYKYFKTKRILTLEEMLNNEFNYI